MKKIFILVLAIGSLYACTASTTQETNIKAAVENKYDAYGNENIISAGKLKTNKIDSAGQGFEVIEFVDSKGCEYIVVHDYSESIDIEEKSISPCRKENREEVETK